VSRSTFALAAILMCAPLASAAGPLKSATLEHSFRIGPGSKHRVMFEVSAVGAAGTLLGSQFTLDAGSAFATQRTLVAGDLTDGGGVLPLTRPITRVLLELGSNGQLVGNLATPSVTPATGITGRLRLRAKIGKAPAFTLVRMPHSVGADYAFRDPR